MMIKQIRKQIAWLLISSAIIISFNIVTKMLGCHSAFASGLLGWFLAGYYPARNEQ